MTISMTKREKTFGWIFLAMTPLALPLALVYLCQLFRWPLDNGELNVLLFAVNFILTLMIFWRFLWQNGRVSIASPGKTFRWVAIGFGIYYGASTLVGMLIMLLAPDFANANDASIQAMAQEHYFLMMLGTVILVPIAEETLYRGLIFGSLRRKSRWLAYVVSIVAFSALHVVSYIGTLSPLHLLLSFLQYLPGSFALAFAYDKADSIWASILIHMTINQIAMLTLR